MSFVCVWIIRSSFSVEVGFDGDVGNGGECFCASSKHHHRQDHRFMSLKSQGAVDSGLVHLDCQ